MKVKYLDFGKVTTAYPEALQAQLEAQAKGELILRSELEEFEKKFAKYIGCKYAVGVANGSDALRLSLKALGIGKGDEVITVAHTFVATIQEIANVGATPILVDVEEETGLIDADKVDKAISDKTKAIIPVHLAGDVAEFPEFWHNKLGYGVAVLDDACQAVGAFSPYDIGCYSFYPAKLLGSPGDGGAIVTNDKKIYEELLKLRNHYNIGKATMGEGKDYIPDENYKFGENSRLDNCYAAFLSKKLDTLDKDIEMRKIIANAYDSEFEDLPIKLPVKRRVYQDYIIRTDKRDELFEYLKKKGIETLGRVEKEPYKFPGLGLDHYDLPVTEKFFAESLRLPCNQFMTPEEVIYVADTVKSFYKQKKIS